MKYRVLLKSNSDSLELWTDWKNCTQDEAGLICFDWYENNNACDCNRYIEFGRAEHKLSETELWDADIECGEVLYSIVRIENDAGFVLNNDSGEWKPNSTAT